MPPPSTKKAKPKIKSTPILELFNNNIEYDGFNPDSLSYRREKAGDTFWSSKSKGLMPVASMSNEHLFNAIRILARNGLRSRMLEIERDKRIMTQKVDNDKKDDTVYIKPARSLDRTIKPMIDNPYITTKIGERLNSPLQLNCWYEAEIAKFSKLPVLFSGVGLINLYKAYKHYTQVLNIKYEACSPPRPINNEFFLELENSPHGTYKEIASWYDRKYEQVDGQYSNKKERRKKLNELFEAHLYFNRCLDLAHEYNSIDVSVKPRPPRNLLRSR